MAAEKKNPSQDKKTALESALKQIEKAIRCRRRLCVSAKTGT